MFRGKTSSKKSFTVVNPKDRTHSLDNAIRLSAIKYKLDPNKKYIIMLTPEADASGIVNKYDKICYPVIIDESVAEDELLPTESIMRYLEYRHNEKINAEIIEISPEKIVQTAQCHFKIVKIRPSYNNNVEFVRSRLQEIIHETLTTHYLLASGQLLYIEYQIGYYNYKIELQVDIPSNDRQNKTYFNLIKKSDITFSTSPAIRNVVISDKPIVNDEDNIVETNSSMIIKKKSDHKKVGNEESLPPIEPLESLFNKQIEPNTPPLISNLSLDFKKMGIGGLENELRELITHVFYPRALGPWAAAYGIKPVKGVLLYGPPGTGKTLIARSIASLFSASKVEVVNGPELKSKYVGESQRKLREIFQNAKMSMLLNSKDLYVVIFDEMDSLFPKRGTRSGGTGVDDDMTSQMLTLLDGVESLNNILVIGTTNRKDLIDDALLRENRFALSLEISLPDHNARKEILEIKTKELKESNLICTNIDMGYWANKTRNYSGADIEKLIRTAKDYAQSRNFSSDAITNTLQLKEGIVNISQLEKIQSADFEKAFNHIKPINGIDKNEFNFNKNKFAVHNNNIKNIIKKFDEHLYRADKQTTLLLHGQHGTGKTEFAKYLAEYADVACIKLITPSMLLGKTSAEQINIIENIFFDARRSESSIIILDNLESILGYDTHYLHCNNEVRLMLAELMDPLKSKNECAIIGTCNRPDLLKTNNLIHYFQEIEELELINLPTICNAQVQETLKLITASLGLTLMLDHTNNLDQKDIALPIKQLIYVVKKCQRNDVVSLSEIYKETARFIASNISYRPGLFIEKSQDNKNNQEWVSNNIVQPRTGNY